MIGALLQARLGSERLPGKVLMDLPQDSGVSMLARIIRRLKKCETLQEIIVVTPDKAIADVAAAEEVAYSIHNTGKRDVLSEFHVAAGHDVDTIVRVTADCPAICPSIVDKIVRAHLEDGKDLTYNRNDNIAYCREIDGIDVEVFSNMALDKAHVLATKPEDREHVTPYIHENFRTSMVECGWHIDNPEDIKLSVDTQEDYDRMCKIYTDLGPDFGMRELQKYFEKDK